MPEYQIGDSVLYASVWQLVVDFIYNRTDDRYVYELSSGDWAEEEDITVSLVGSD